ncbi:hypothetical protein [Aquihabitans sp. McL0605]|uniref:hypothetical protein n=1 Tax=Aquihabitans sp. McL0605 TaxID=3415671 RepID=UPI003CF48D00
MWALVGIAQGHLLLGDGASAAAALEYADARTSPLATSWSTRERACAWLLACHGDLGLARRLIAQVAEASAEHLWNFECGVVHDLVRFGDPEAAVGRLGELEQLVQGPYIRGPAAHARAAVTGDTARRRRGRAVRGPALLRARCRGVDGAGRPAPAGGCAP